MCASRSRSFTASRRGEERPLRRARSEFIAQKDNDDDKVKKRFAWLKGEQSYRFSIRRLSHKELLFYGSIDFTIIYSLLRLN